MAVSLNVNVDQLERANSGAIWGGVWIEVGGEPFPEVGWNDMSVAFVVQYVKSLRELLRRRGSKLRVHFFDGPYWVELTREEDLILVSTNNGLIQRCTPPELASSARMATEAAAKLAAACIQHGWQEQDDVRLLIHLVNNV